MKPLQDYFLEKYKYPAYVKTTDLLTKMRVHSDGVKDNGFADQDARAFRWHLPRNIDRRKAAQ